MGRERLCGSGGKGQAEKYIKKSWRLVLMLIMLQCP